MDVHACIRTRREVREFEDKPIPEESLRKILEAGRLAPSQRNRQPWHFVVVRERGTLKRLGALAESGPYLAEAPCAVAVALAGAKMPQVDGTRAIQQMLLAAWAEGVGSCWVGMIRREEAKELLGIPKEMDLLTVLPFGYPRGRAKGKKDRKPLREVAHRERFGVPFE